MSAENMTMYPDYSSIENIQRPLVGAHVGPLALHEVELATAHVGDALGGVVQEVVGAPVTHSVREMPDFVTPVAPEAETAQDTAPDAANEQLLRMAAKLANRATSYQQPREPYRFTLAA